MIHIIIAEDHQVLTDGIKAMLGDRDDMKIVGEASDGLEVFDLLRLHQVDIILLDLELPGMDGEEICRQLPIAYPEVKPLILTMHSEKERISTMMELGAKGYLLKNTGKAELIEAIHTVMRGETFFGKSVTQSLLQDAHNPAASKAYFPKITRREKEVLKLIVEGYTNPEIAEKLNISFKTVDSHRTNLLEKLNARNTAALVRITLENQLI